MIHDHNFMQEAIDIKELITWLQKEAKGGAEVVTLRASHLDDPESKTMEPIDEYDETVRIQCIRIEAD